MSGHVRGTTVLLVGAVLVRLTLTGAYQKYVRPGMGPWLLLAGALLAALGLATLVSAWRHPAPHTPDTSHTSHTSDAPDTPHAPDTPDTLDAPDTSDGDHLHGAGRVGWLLLAPVLALLLVTPPALGSYAVDRAAPAGVTIGGSARTFDPLPAASAPRPMTLLEFTQRAQDRAGGSFAGRTVRLAGFVADPGADDTSDGFRLARYQIACCAADAVAAVVRVVGAAGPPPARDTWVAVTGTFRAVGTGGVPELTVADLTPVPTPVDPYE